MYVLLTCVAFLVGRLPDRGLDLCAEALTILWWDILRVRRALVLKNLTTAFGAAYSDSDRARIGRASVKSACLTFFEFLHAAGRRGGTLADHVKIEGRAGAEASLAEGKGAMFICLHIGNWEALGCSISRYVRPMHILIKKVGGRGVNRFVVNARRRSGFVDIERQSRGDGARQIIRALKAGDIVGFVMDQSRPGEPKLPFFGYPAKTNTGFATLWARCGEPPVHVCFTYRVGVRRHVAVIGSRVTLQNSGDYRGDILHNSQVMNHLLEEVIRQHPEQYFWLHNRWKE